MASIWTTLHQASGAVASATDYDFDLTIPANVAILGKIKTVPSATVKGYSLKIYKRATRLLADLHYSSKDPKTGSLFDPSDRNGNEVLQGLIIAYETLDADSKIHLRLHNYDSVSRSYDIYVDYVDPTVLGMSNYVPAEVVTFTGVNGSLSRAASAAVNIRLYRNGNRLRQGSGLGYTVAGNKKDLTLTIAAGSGEYFEAEHF